MIAALMLYSLAVTLLLAVAATAAEHLLRLARRPARLVWVVAMVATTALTIARFQSGLAAPAPVTDFAASRLLQSSRIVDDGRRAPATVAHTPTLRQRAASALDRLNAARVQVVSGSAVTRFDRPLVMAWIALSLVGLIVIGLSTLRLARPRRRWTTATVDGVPVLVSHDLGPAVIGVLRYQIVLPKWALEMAPAERDLILAHEREHANAGDPSLLFLATVLIALSPWNAAFWWMARRLRFAIELDCDARVLRNRPDSRVYGSLLLDVSERTLGGAMPIAALAEPVSLIERRIAAMTARLPRFAALRGVAAALVAVALVAAACATPHPANVPAPRDAKGAPRADSNRVTVEIPASSMRSELRDTAQSRLTVSLDSTRRTQRSLAENFARADSAANYYRLRLAMAESQLDSMRQLSVDVTAANSRAAFAVEDSARRLVRGDGGRGYARAGGVQDCGIAYAGGACGADSISPKVQIPRGAFGGSVRRDSVNWSRAQGTGATAGGFGASASRMASADSSYDRAVSGAVAAQGVRFREMEARVERMRGLATKYFPEAFAVHENEHDLIVLVFDSTGVVVNMGIAKRPPIAAGERLLDRNVLKAVLPNVSIDAFREWGLTDISTTRQSAGSGVTLMYGFTGKAPW